MSEVKATRTTSLQDRGVNAAERFLERQGYTILETKWRRDNVEVDIIAENDDALVFVDVTTRDSSSSGLPEETVSATKRAYFERAAITYLKEYEGVNITVRFDVVSILAVLPKKAFLRHHIDAFAISG